MRAQAGGPEGDSSRAATRPGGWGRGRGLGRRKSHHLRGSALTRGREGRPGFVGRQQHGLGLLYGDRCTTAGDTTEEPLQTQK